MMESIFIALNLEAPCFPQDSTVRAASVQAWPSICGLHDLFALCWDNCVGGSCVPDFQEAAAHPTVTTSVMNVICFPQETWIASVQSELFGLYYCHSIKSLASPSSIIYLRLSTNLHLLLNPVLAFCLDAFPTNVLQLLFSLILLSWIAAQ